MNRIQSIDLLRGVAVLGILIMNIQSFSMPGSAYLNPTSYGDLNGINKWVWMISHLFADTKFMSLFSMLFGAGIILLTDKLKATDRPVKKIWYSRLFWLFIFGLMHAFLLWHGDILVYYAICGFVVYFLRNKSPKFLLRLGIFFFIIPILWNLFNYTGFEFIPDENVAEIQETWNPTEEFKQNEIAVYKGDFSGKMAHRIEQWIGMFIFYFLFMGLWRIMAMMLFGMYFYKKGIITAEKDNIYYRSLLFKCLPIGLVFIIFGIWYNFNQGWTVKESMFLGSQFNYIGSVFMAISYMALIMIWSKSEIWQSAQTLLQKVGKMAFTNYILMSIICTFFFNVLGYYGEYSRMAQLAFTGGVWIVLIIFTSLWLRRFKMGPLEWLWRSLTYWKKAELR